MSIFTQIIDKKIPADIVYENDFVFAIKDISPQAPVHLLIIPKKEIATLQLIKEEDQPLFIEMMKAVQHLAKEFAIENGYRLVVNNGKGAGQTVYHLHFHLLGGKTMSHSF